MLSVPLYLLKISALRPAVPLPWPTAHAVALARQVGFVDPVTVRPIPQTVPQNYEILTGLRHWLLAQRAQLSALPILIRDSLDDDEARRLIEQDLGGETTHPIAEAEVLQSWVEDGLSITAAGQVLNLSRTEASHRLRLLQLVPSVQARVAKGALEPGKARALVGLTGRAQLELAQRIERERLNTRQVEVLAKAYKQGGENRRVDAPAEPSPPGKDPNITRLENELSELIGTRVTVNYAEGGRGQLVIDFDDLEIFDGVLARMGYVP